MQLSLTLLTVLAIALPVFSAPTPDELDGRALTVKSGVACKGAFQCRNVKRPWNSAAQCVDNICSYSCYDGFSDLGYRCIRTVASSSSSVVATPTSTQELAAASPTVTLTANAVQQAGVKAFTGNNTNAIISWFHTNLNSDSTNGHSWCGYPYSDAVPGFAPSLATMLANFNGSYQDAATAFCGLEAVVTTPEGRSATLYIADAFDDTWVRTPASIDVVYGSFPLLFGKQTDNKNDVVKQGSWVLTGRRNERYKFKGLGSTGL
ncbi:hypothetical protein JCM10213_009128 [Rhodosporidiobolus nylandii]